MKKYSLGSYKAPWPPSGFKDKGAICFPNVKAHQTKYKLMVSQCIHAEYKSINLWYHSVFTLNTRRVDGVMDT
ncbi:hypothetical protein OUZ56_012732 [Daphnia magna]|uniref:Uncharacterized protein n=1 Tax=Daphnia magna TaxID=35525 RepID=A0ABQ9Z3V9_9CRUS|nr:hypothetical protein OUZ56_012732 [Daphnia magna]